MSIYSGNNINKIFIGNTSINAVFAGNIQVFPVIDTPIIEDEIIKVGFDFPNKSELIYVAPSGKYIMGMNDYQTPNTFYSSKIYSIDSSLNIVTELNKSANQYAGSIINNDLYVYINNSNDYDFVYKYDDTTNSLKKIVDTTSYWFNNIVEIDGRIFGLSKNIYEIKNNKIELLYNQTVNISAYWGTKIADDIIFNYNNGIYRYNGTTTTKFKNWGSSYPPYYINDKYYYLSGVGIIGSFISLDNNLNDKLIMLSDFTINATSYNKLPIQIINNELYIVSTRVKDNKKYLYKLNADDTFTELIEIDLQGSTELLFFKNYLYVLAIDEVVKGSLVKYNLNTFQKTILIDGTQDYFLNTLSLSSDKKKLFISCNDGWRYIE